MSTNSNATTTAGKTAARRFAKVFDKTVVSSRELRACCRVPRSCVNQLQPVGDVSRRTTSCFDQQSAETVSHPIVRCASKKYLARPWAAHSGTGRAELQSASCTEYSRFCFCFSRIFRKQFDDDSIVVYQAFNADIARHAVKHQRFTGCAAYSPTRMTWIKSNFCWMMFRSQPRARLRRH